MFELSLTYDDKVRVSTDSKAIANKLKKLGIHIATLYGTATFELSEWSDFAPTIANKPAFKVDGFNPVTEELIVTVDDLDNILVTTNNKKIKKQLEKLKGCETVNHYINSGIVTYKLQNAVLPKLPSQRKKTVQP